MFKGPAVLPIVLKLAAVIALCNLYSAQAQVGVGVGTPFTCSFDAGTPTYVRSEGLAELVSDIVITCSGGTPGAGGTANISVFLNTAVMSKPIAPGLSEVVLLVDDPSTTPTLGVNIIQGSVAGNVVTFSSVPLVAPPTGGIRKLRIKNLRANASQVTAGGPTPATVNASISISSAIPISIPTVSVTVAIATRGVYFSLQAADGSPVPSLTFQQNGGQNAQLLTNPAAGGAVLTNNIMFTEGFLQSFKKRNAGTTIDNPLALTDQDNPTAAYNTESGYYSAALSATNALNTAGLASQGTLLKADFFGIPAGVSLFVTVQPLSASGPPAAVLVDPNSPNSVLTAINTVNVNGFPIGIFPVSLTNGSGSAVWQVFNPDPTAFESYKFGLVAAYTAPQTHGAEVTGVLGPVSTVYTTGDASTPIPRFVDATAAVLACESTACLQVAPQSVALTAIVGVSTPITVPLLVTSSTDQLQLSVAGATTSGSGWLSVSPAGGATPLTLSVTANPAGLLIGTYSGTITVSASNGAVAVVPVTLTIAAAVNGQPISCNGTSSSVADIIRAEGIAELLSDTVIVCTGGVPGNVQNTTVQLSVSAPITSRILNAASGATEVILLLDEPNSGLAGTTNLFIPGTNVFQGILTSPTTISFSNIPLVGTVSGQVRVMRVVNLRADATGFGLGTQQIGLISVAATISIVTMAPQQASSFTFTQKGLAFGVNSTAGPVNSLTFQQAGGSNTGLALSPNATDGTVTYDLQFAETFTTLFKTRGQQSPPATVVDQNVPGHDYNDETGFYNSTLPAANGLNQAGLATQGTRLMTRFTGVPSGVSLYVTVVPTNAVSGGIGAQLVQTDTAGAGPYSPTPATTTALINGVVTGIAPVSLSGGSGTAVWEVTAANSSSLDTAHFGVLAVYTNPQPASAFVEGTFGPLSSVHAADTGSPLPRFIELNPPTLTATGGTSQSAGVSNSFASPLQVTLKDGSGSPLIGVAITFTAPTNGAGATLSASTALTNSLGVASVIAQANSVPGTYSVTATVGSFSTTFSLTNTSKISTHISTPTVTGILIFGNPLTFSVTVSVTTGTPTGIATFYDGSTVLGTGALNGSGVATFTTSTLAANISHFISALYGGDSNYSPSTSSAVMTGVADGTPSAVSVSPASGSGSSHTFTFQFSDMGGFATLSMGQVVINAGLDGNNGCFFLYEPANNNVYLYNDATANFLQTSIGNFHPIQNNQCTLTNGSVALSGINVALTVAITFKPAFSGPKSIYLQALGASGASSGFVLEGSWNALNAVPPTVVSVTPSSGLGLSQSFTFQFSDPNGFANLSMGQIIVNSSLNGNDACYFLYEPSNNNVYLYNDGAANFLQTSLGSFQPIRNNQCSLVSGSVVLSGNNVALTLGITFNAAFSGAKSVYMQAIDVAGLTSGFVLEGSWNVLNPAPPSAVSVAPSSGSGLSQGFTFQFSDPNGFANLSMGQIIVNSSLNGNDACYFLYEPGNNNVYLYNDGTANFLQTSLGSFQPIRNNQCSLVSGSVVLSGNNVALTLGITFNAAFSGAKSVYMQAIDVAGLTSGFVLEGSWNVSNPAMPSAISVSPASGSGSNQSFAFQFSDPSGFSNLSMGQVIINSSLTGNNGCFFLYEPSNNNVYLYDDGAGSFLQTPLGVFQTIQNNQCTLASGSVALNGNNVTLTLSISFKAGFAGGKTVFMQALDAAGPTSGWVTKGTWTVQ